MATGLVPPCSRALQADMTDKLVRRFAPAPAQRVAPAAQRAIIGAAARRVERPPAGVNRVGRFVRGRLPTPPATQPGCAMARGQTGQGGFTPCQRLSGMARVRVRPLLERRGTMGRVEPLAGVRTQRLPVLP